MMGVQTQLTQEPPAHSAAALSKLVLGLRKQHCHANAEGQNISQLWEFNPPDSCLWHGHTQGACNLGAAPLTGKASWQQHEYT